MIRLLNVFLHPTANLSSFGGVFSVCLSSSLNFFYWHRWSQFFKLFYAIFEPAKKWLMFIMCRWASGLSLLSSVTLDVVTVTILVSLHKMVNCHRLMFEFFHVLTVWCQSCRWIRLGVFSNVCPQKNLKKNYMFSPSVKGNISCDNR